MTSKVQRTVSAWIAAIGLALVVMMITTEGELGALPLGLILLGAIGYVNRKDFTHWGVPPSWDDPAWKEWFEGAKSFGKAIWEALGEKTNPRIVFEHQQVGGGAPRHTDVEPCDHLAGEGRRQLRGGTVDGIAFRHGRPRAGCRRR